MEVKIHNVINACNELIEALQRNTPNGWRSVKNELPKENEKVLLFISGNITIGWLKQKHWAWGYGYHTFEQCTYWQPLPAKPDL